MTGPKGGKTWWCNLEVEHIRQRHGLTGIEIARAMHVTVVMLSYYRSMKRAVPPHRLRLLQLELGIVDPDHTLDKIIDRRIRALTE